MKAITIKLAESLDQALASAARRGGRTKSACIRDTLHAAVQPGRRRRSETFFDLAGHLAGCVKGSGDLSDKKRRLKDFGR